MSYSIGQWFINKDQTLYHLVQIEFDKVGLIKVVDGTRYNVCIVDSPKDVSVIEFTRLSDELTLTLVDVEINVTKL